MSICQVCAIYDPPLCSASCWKEATLEMVDQCMHRLRERSCVCAFVFVCSFVHVRDWMIEGFSSKKHVSYVYVCQKGGGRQEGGHVRACVQRAFRKDYRIWLSMTRIVSVCLCVRYFCWFA